jgi:DNA-binding NarL/FixJ family response regulator
VVSATEPAARKGHAVSEIIQVLVVDDHPLLRGGIAALLGAEADVTTVAEAANGFEALTAFREHQPHVTLMDLQMPGMGGIDAIMAIRSEYPRARIIVLTTYEGDVLAQRALKAGAQAYVLKGQAREDLVETIRAVHQGQMRVQPDIAQGMASHTSFASLTAREVEVLSLVASGHSNRSIARKLVIADETAKGHVKSILAKLGANDRTHAVTLGLRRGIIQL